MANTVSNFLEIVGTSEVKEAMDNLFSNAGGYADTTQFVNTFYGTEFENGVSHDWLFENVGSKWIYVENEIGEGEWNISSAGYTPEHFWIHLYQKAVEIDPNVEIVVKFQDESYEPIGGFVVKKDHEGVPRWSMVEEYDVEDPTADMDWDDEDYDDTQMQFMEDLDDMLTNLVNTAHDNVWSTEGKKLDEK
jgi:hypothetical protein